MQCFICVTYMIILCGAHPAKDREVSPQHEKRSLFRDVIESLRIHAQLPEDFNQNEENKLSQNYERYGYEDEAPEIAIDRGFVPRRNDRVEMPSTNYRFPKSLNNDTTEKNESPKEEFVLYIETTSEPKTTQKPKKTNRPYRPNNKNKIPLKNKQNEEADEDEVEIPPAENIPLYNNMAGQSQVGNRESQTVVKPTVIINIRGTVTHQDGEIRLGSRKNNDTAMEPSKNVFHINQEINVDRADRNVGKRKEPNTIKHEVKIIGKVEEDMMMCETATWSPQKNRESRKSDVLQILLSV
ncbi:uncharacterized protein LOC113514940 [Galleria mellonella]|uniref:Uncharacterized protein LOC113514940 n=1 Tax=Galleria mellonella TaxID=7137 RepID=A0A6J1WJS3_GALME|nr:uncharacterized protein LOC113514940 [Galleria mellonella]